MAAKVHVVNVFAASPGGGNPSPIVAVAAGLSDQEMQDVARAYGQESGFVLPPPSGSDCDYSFRFWVPHHEMEMCGHATVGGSLTYEPFDSGEGGGGGGEPTTGGQCGEWREMPYG